MSKRGGLFVLYERDAVRVVGENETWTPIGITTAASPERAVEMLREGRAQAGIFAPGEFRAVPFYGAPVDDAVRAALDCLLNLLGTASIASSRPGSRRM